MRAGRTAAALGAALSLTLLLSGCVSAFLPARPESTSVPTGERVAAELEPYYGQSLVWSPCEDGMQCATARAPLDWDDPAGESIDLALVRHTAPGGDPLGSLLLNPGGPGGSGFDLVADSLDFAVDETLQSRFDVVGFDPRGVGRSSPVACLEPDEMDSYLYDVTDSERGSDQWIAEVTDSNVGFAQACDERTGPLLGEVDTVSAARDLDMLRAALGDDVLYYLGYSYGTYLGAVFADLFPDKVGRLVLDGAIDPAATNADITAAQARGFESALTSYLTECLTTTATPCPFSGTVDDALQTVSDLLASVDRSPIRAQDGRDLGSTTLLTAIIYPLYQREAWPTLTRMFETVLAGDANLAFSLADAYNGREADGTYRDNSSEAFVAVNCLDYSYDADVRKMRDEAARLESEAPVIGRYLTYGDLQCDVWPYTSTVVREPLDAAGAAPILVVGTTNDPATPYEWAVALSEQLDSAQLVTFTGEGHTAYNKSNRCVNDAVDAYLVSGTVPAQDPDC